jgi:putative addiction module killer protein
VYPEGYNLVVRVLRTDIYERWFRRLKDTQGKARINIALRRCTIAGKVVGDTKPLGHGVSELRIHTGPGYRVYYLSRGNEMMLLMLGGDKSSQDRDIEKAKRIAKELKEEGKWQ